MFTAGASSGWSRQWGRYLLLLRNDWSWRGGPAVTDQKAAQDPAAVRRLTKACCP